MAFSLESPAFDMLERPRPRVIAEVGLVGAYENE